MNSTGCRRLSVRPSAPMNNNGSGRRKVLQAGPAQRGMTLIEVMIVVVIIGVLASIAYPSYQEYVRNSRRADAASALVQLAQFMERFYTVNHRYDETNPGGDDVALPFTEAPVDGTRKYYDLEIQAVTANTYTLRAVPKDVMSGDPCGNLTLTHTGVRGRTGTLEMERCWR